MGKIFQWEDYQPSPVAQCPECGGTTFHIRVDGYGNNWKNLIGTECEDCGGLIDWSPCENNEERSGKPI